MTYWKVTWRFALALPLLFAVAAPARANFIYDITVDTSSLLDSMGNPLVNSQGYVDLQFNPEIGTGNPPSNGTGTLYATVDALAANDTSLDSLIFSQGNVTGSVPPLTFAADNTNGGQINEAFFSVTFGTKVALSLDVIPADANSTASFFLTLYDGNGGPVDAISYDPNDPFASGTNTAVVELDLFANPSGDAPTVGLQLGVGADAEPEAVAAPAPSSVILLGTALVCLAGYGLRKRLSLWAMMG